MEASAAVETCPEAMPLAAGFGDGRKIPKTAKPPEPLPVQPRAWGQSSSGNMMVNVSGDEAVHAARRTIEALTLLLIAYGKAESMDDDPKLRYSDLTSYWGQFLDTMMTKVKGVI